MSMCAAYDPELGLTVPPPAAPGTAAAAAAGACDSDSPVKARVSTTTAPPTRMKPSSLLVIPRIGRFPPLSVMAPRWGATMIGANRRPTTGHLEAKSTEGGESLIELTRQAGRPGGPGPRPPPGRRCR